MKSTTVVEVLGPAGAGKTTVVHVLKERGIVVRDNLSLPWHTKLSFLGQIERELLPAYLCERRNARFFNLEELRRMVYVKAWSHELARHRDAKEVITVLDHGPIFMLGMVREFGPEFVRNRRFVRWFEEAVTTWRAALDLVLWLDAPDDILVQRIASRERNHPTKGRPLAEACEFIQRCRLSFERILSQITLPGGPNLLRFTTSTMTPDEIVDRLLQELGPAAAFSDASSNVSGHLVTIPSSNTHA